MWTSHAGSESGGGLSAGGGYVQSPGGFGSPAATQDKRPKSRSQNIVPCTVSQLFSAQQVDETFQVRDVEISQVLIMGLIRQAEKAPTNILYKVDDMTAAPMDVRQWVDTDEAGSENIVVPPGTYVKVAGHLRSFQNKKSLVAFKIKPLENMNEFTTHLLEIVNAHMILRKQTKEGSKMLQSLSSSGMGTVSYGGMSNLPVNGLTVHQSQVLNLIKTCSLPEGMSLQDLQSQLHNINMTTIKQAVEFLSSEGHIYSTVDDEHYRSTDAE
ncbi:replication protein A 32 kDa subunit isoform X1 [Alligator mississippiensis]|uniref:Replication factor A protein 2 n=1 Tax=Alligator mississippiensis TaxID=8496 RepID=A0A151PHA4_ALLMI|nr:replication protein A 32 kDa subunit isoform X1 [Alligator mississippiensis]KYO48155.1 replication protein A subunit [Alligator mississippiensis]